MDKLKPHIDCYNNDKFRDLISFDILRNSLIIFESAKIINSIIDLKNQLPIEKHNPQTVMDFILEYRIDTIKISLFFENYMKFCLLQKNYVIHEINKNEYKDSFDKQKNEPIKILYLNNKKHQILTEKTIGLNVLLKDKYQEIISLPTNILKFLKEDLSKLRNSLHFCYSHPFELSNEFINNIKNLITFRNEIALKEFEKLKIKLNK